MIRVVAHLGLVMVVDTGAWSKRGTSIHAILEGSKLVLFDTGGAVSFATIDSEGDAENRGVGLAVGFESEISNMLDNLEKTLLTTRAFCRAGIYILIFCRLSGRIRHIGLSTYTFGVNISCCDDI